MNVLMGLFLMSTGALLILSNRYLVDRLSSGTVWFHDLDESTSRQNLVIVGALMALTGLAFFLL